MLLCKQVKLSERRSAQRFNHSGSSSIIIRPCTLKNITEVNPKGSNITPTLEKRSPELRVVSLNLDNELYNKETKKIVKSPYRMPLYCVHFKRVQKIYHKDEKELEDDFLVRGFEMGSGSTPKADAEQFDIDHEDELPFLQNGIQIRLTDCCQCVCDLFNYSNFQTTHSDHDFSFVAMESCNPSRSIKSKEVEEMEKNNILDPDILKVIRVTMNSKNQC